MEIATFDQLKEAVEKEDVISAKADNKTYRFFISGNGVLCYFKTGSRKRGFPVDEDLFSKFKNYVGKPSELDKKKIEFRIIEKFRKYAEKASFDNNFIRQCKELPKTLDEWSKDNYKSAYEYGITTGCKITGQIISLNSIAKQYPQAVERARECIKNKTIGTCLSTVPFRNYDTSMSFQLNDKNELVGFLSLEYKGCGNGYYYLLINDENFIGYDVD
jgi:hypothetical protein